MRGQELGKSISSCLQPENPSVWLSMLPTYPRLSLCPSGVLELQRVSAPGFCLLLQEVLRAPTGKIAPNLHPQKCQNEFVKLLTHSLAWVWTVLSSNPTVTLCTLRRSPAASRPPTPPRRARRSRAHSTARHG